MSNPIEIVPEKYYVITHKEKFNSVLIEGIFIYHNPLDISRPITDRYYVREATLPEIALYAKPPVNK